ncbi:MAG TPA: methyltransferase domain-containing protein [Actinocrinis sp.]|jgi:trans-aconitate 2-methyltransferase
MSTPAQSTSWEPDRYLRYAGQRARPFADLLAQVGAEAPGRVVDLGCGPGNATELLADRWPCARVLGVDNSAEMVAAAARRARPGRLEFTRADLREWRAADPVDVLITNATLQWVPGHLELLPQLLRQVSPGGWFAFGVPGNFGAPSHTLLGDLQRTARWRDRFTGAQYRPASHEPAEYLRVLTDAAADADVWETTYHYVVDGEDGVFDFVSSTALRPVLVELGGAETPDAKAFTAEYAAALREAYPATEHAGRIVQILPYRRLFAVARVA